MSSPTYSIRLLLTSEELAVARQMDWTTDSPTITEHQPDVRRHGYFWDHDRARPVLQIGQTICSPTRVSFSYIRSLRFRSLTTYLVYVLPLVTEYQGLGLSPS
jgi:hypothetical protein